MFILFAERDSAQKERNIVPIITVILTMMIVSHRIGIESDADGSRCDRITNVRLCNSKVTDRIAIVTLHCADSLIDLYLLQTAKLAVNLVPERLVMRISSQSLFEVNPCLIAFLLPN